jgi:serine/threonine protein kinase
MPTPLSPLDPPSTDAPTAGEAPFSLRVPALPDASEAPGTRIGRYKILQRIGEGGFGAVFMAEQEEPVKRRVALKIIKLGMDTRQVVARFEQERQALAVMDHPNIAKVFDAGATETGRPYFVMELVKGEPITAFCDRNNLTVRDRLELFLQVCHAVQHAHHKGVIHRDLKPSNVLVFSHDGRPVAKVIDFGIAKAADYRFTEKTIFTEFHQLVGTPAYMSPEQADGSLDIDTRTDVYSLGVLLYELLTGFTPFDQRSLASAAYAEIQRIIREVEPPKPSTRVSSQREALPAIAACRRVEPRRLGLLLRGDLDWVVMRALEKDRQRRYLTPGDLAADLERYLHDEPVTAGPPSAAYRMRKFVRRHRAGVATAAALLTMLVVGLVATGALYKREALQRARAERESAKVNAANDFMSGMFGAIDPAVAKGRDITVREVLDKAATRAEKELSDQPEVEGSVREVLGEAYHHISRFPEAERQLRRALAVREQSLGPEQPETLTTLHNLAASVLEQDRPDDAAAVIKRAVDGRLKTLGPAHKDTLASRSLQAFIRQLGGDLAGAEKDIRAIIGAQSASLGPAHHDTIESRNSLADILHDEGKLEEALTTAVQASSDATKTLGDDDPLTMDARSIQGAILKDLGREDQAEPVLRSVVAAKSRVYGADAPQTLLSSDILASTLRALKKYDEALGLERSIVDRAKRVNGPDHTATLTYMNNLAQTLRLAGQLDEAETIYRAVLEARKKDGPTQQNLITTYNLGLLKIDQGKPAEAAPIFEEVIAGFEKNLGKGHWMIGTTRASLGDALAAQGKLEEAETQILKGYDLVVAGLSATHWRAQKAARSAADLYAKWNKPEQAKEWEAKAKP